MPTRTKPNEIERRADGTVRIAIKDGVVAVISDASAEAVLSHKWYASPHSMGGHYATTRIDKKTAYMHRLIMGAQKGETVDHINHDTLDNRLVNLRILSNANNAQNRKGAYRSRNSTGVRGVCLDYRNGATYLKPRVMLNGGTYTGPYFPHSKQGLKDAAQWTFDKRRELMPYASHAPFVSDEALAQMPDTERPRAYASGSAHGMARHTEQDIRDIRRLAREGVKQIRIAEQYGISSGSVSQIVNRVLWAHLEDE